MRFMTVVLMLALAPSIGRAQSPAQLYQRATQLERAQGKLDSAIVLYQRVAASAGPNRSLAARALLRLGGAYELLGRTEARAAYARLVREFGEQDEAAEARRRLAELERPAEVATSRALRQRELWSGPDVATPASISRDGTTLVYTDWSTGDLAKRDVRRGVSQRLTDKGPWQRSSQFAEQTTVSPDGTLIAYSWFTDAGPYELRVMPVSGGSPTVVPLPTMSYVAPYDWMPDGRSVLAGLKARDAQGDTAMLAIVGIDGTVRRVATINWRWTIAASASPDGQWIVFDAADATNGQRDVRVVRADGTRMGTLVSHPAHDWFPMWTPDGRSVVFLSDRTGAWVLMAIDVVDGAPRGTARVIKSDFGGNHPFGITRDGGFVYGPQRPSSDIMVAELNIDSATIGEPRSVTRSFVGRNQFPVWSPDGHTLGFISVRGTGTGLPGERTLVTIDLQTGIQREFTGTLAYLLRARWMPDGRNILLSGRRRVEDEDRSMYLLDPATNAITERPAPGHFAAFELTRDGTRMLYARADTLMGVLGRFTFANQREERLFRVSGRGRIGAFAESPDGTRIAVTAVEQQGTEGARTVTHIIDTEGRILRTLPNAVPSGFFQLNWSPDGRYLVAIADNEPGKNQRTLWRVPVDGGAPTKFNLSNRVVSTLRLTADGKRAAMLLDDPTQTAPAIWIVEGLVAPAKPPSR